MTLAISPVQSAEPNAPANAIHVSGLLERISVRAPYFALEDLTINESGAAIARVPLARPVHPETGLMEAAQVARHLAILGSCAVAAQREDSKRHHYLATKAHFLRTANVALDLEAEDPTTADYLVAEAVGTWVDRRSAQALVKLLGPDGQVSHVLDVHYTVMAPRMFTRLMPPIDPAGLVVADIGRDNTEPVSTEMADGGLVVDCGPIPVEMCAGHFDGYPAAPVALVMGRLARAAGEAMNQHLGFGPLTYQVDEARVVANKLGRAGQQLTLEARYARRVGGGHLLIGQAKADDDIIGEMEITLSTTSLPAPIPFPVNALA